MTFLDVLQHPLTFWLFFPGVLIGLLYTAEPDPEFLLAVGLSYYASAFLSEYQHRASPEVEDQRRWESLRAAANRRRLRRQNRERLPLPPRKKHP